MEKHSSIFNFDPKCIPWGFVIFMAMALAFEGAVWSLERMNVFDKNHEQAQIRGKGDLVDGKNGYDILVLGDCKGWAGINPAVIEREMPITAYNLSINVEQTCLMSYVLLERYLRNCTKAPRLVILQVSALSFLGTHNMSLNGLRSHVLPYFRGGDDIEREFSRETMFRHFEYRVLTALPSLRRQYVLKDPVWLFEGLIFPDLKMDADPLFAEKGFFNEDLYLKPPALKGGGVLDDVKQDIKSFYISRYNLFYINKILSLLAERRIKVVLCTMPVQAEELAFWSKYEVKERLAGALRQLQKVNGNVIAAWEMSDTVPQKEYFFDRDHLGSKGADLFTRELARRIKQLAYFP